MILVAGDSWAAGEWVRGDAPLRPDGTRYTGHGGLVQYLKEDGITAIDLCEQGLINTNLQIHYSIQNYLMRFVKDSRIDKIFVFQSEYARDDGYVFEEDWNNVTDVNTIANIWISRFYSRLSELSTTYNVPIYLIGGSSDTIWLDDISKYYPGLTIACQSMVNLLINGNNRINTPVLSLYRKFGMELSERIQSCLPADKHQDLADQIELGRYRENLMFSCTKYFYPDGYHPNREGHKILFDYLKAHGHLD